MYAKFSYENRIQEKMRALEITSDFLAVLAGIPASRLSQSFRGLKALSNSDGEMLLGVLKELESLAERAAPIPVAFRNPVLIRALLRDRGETKAEAAAQ
jgi:hypothetical protein